MNDYENGLAFNARQILRQSGHRPWQVPQQPWLMTQRWSDLLFAHWPIEPDKMKPLIPTGLELDLFNGQAWITIVPFGMGFRLRFSPYLHLFGELNVRTYVVRDGKPGVFFLSLDADDRLTVLAARRTFSLPYFQADIQRSLQDGHHHFSSQRKGSGEHHRFSASYQPVSPVYHAEPNTLEHWLTERYCLYSARADGSLYRGDVHHLPWPLQQAEATIGVNTILDGTGLALPSDTAPLLQASKHLDIVIWAPKKLK